jgi:2-dehydro-3-deoxygalactonokinase
LLGGRDDADAASFASGLLIGSEVSARLAQYCHDTVHILADPALGGLYQLAIEAHGRPARIIDSKAAFAAGVIAIGAEARATLLHSRPRFQRCLWSRSCAG